LCCHNKQYGGAGTAAESLPLRLPACLRASVPVSSAGVRVQPEKFGRWRKN